MKKLKWRFIKKENKWVAYQFIHPTIYIKKCYDFSYERWELYFSGRVTITIPFSKVSTAKQVAQLIHNG